jgi:hypothetical protein
MPTGQPRRSQGARFEILAQTLDGGHEVDLALSDDVVRERAVGHLVARPLVTRRPEGLVRWR